MKFTPLELHGAYLIEVERIEDERGFFARTYCPNEFAEHGIEMAAAQSNVSFNTKRGTLRGMHYQAPPHEEAKLVRCTRGAIWDVLLDLRPSSTSYLQWRGFELTQDSHQSLYVPKGFAHGFITLTDDAEVLYLMSEFFVMGAGRGARWDDPAFGIDWPTEPVVMSAKDRHYADFAT